MKIRYIEIHRYAPELNRVIFKSGVSLSCPGVTSIREFREGFKPRKSGKYAIIRYNNPTHPNLNRVYSGYCTDGYHSIITTLKVLKKRHNMPGGEFTIHITTV